MEAKPHRYDAALSDISGQDIEVHANDPAEAIRRVRNWLSEHRKPKEPPLPGAAALLGDYRLFRKEARAILREQRLDPLDRLSHNDFLFVATDWIAKRAKALA